MLRECFSHWVVTKNDQAYDRYSYESARAIYDVDICKANGKRTYHIGEGEPCLPCNVHRSIEKFFDVIIPGARSYTRSRYQSDLRETNIHNQVRKSRPLIQFYAYKPLPDGSEPPENNPDNTPNRNRTVFRLKTHAGGIDKARRLYGSDVILFEFGSFLDRSTWVRVL